MKHSALYENIKNNKPFKKTDVFFVAFLVVSILTLYIITLPKNNGSYAEIYKGNELVKVMYLNTDSEFVYQFDEDHKNVITVKDGKIFVTESDCNDKICLHYHPSNKAGSTIVCLPHSLFIIIKGDDQLDGVI